MAGPIACRRCRFRRMRGAAWQGSARRALWNFWGWSLRAGALSRGAWAGGGLRLLRAPFVDGRPPTPDAGPLDLPHMPASQTATDPLLACTDARNARLALRLIPSIGSIPLPNQFLGPALFAVFEWMIRSGAPAGRVAPRRSSAVDDLDQPDRDPLAVFALIATLCRSARAFV